MIKVSGHYNFFSGMFSLDIALTMVRGLRRLLALAPHLAPLLLFFRPATNREHPAANRDCPATNPDRHATNRNIVFRTRKQISTKWRTNFWTIYLGRITILNYWVIKAEPSQFWTFNATKWTNIFLTSWKYFSDLPEIETALAEIETALPEIDTALPETETALPEIETALPEPRLPCLK